MNSRIIRMAKVLGIPLESPRWAEGDAWYEDPVCFRMLSRIYVVMEYLEAEFGIRDDEERGRLQRFLHDLHSAFCHNLERGKTLNQITFPAEVLIDYEADFGGHFPSAVIVEKLRTQFEDYKGA